MTPNPLLASIDTLIDYAAIKPAHIEPAIDALLSSARAAIEQAADQTLPATWEAIVAPADTASSLLWRAWSVAGHLNAVVNTPELRAAYNAVLPKVTAFSTWVGLHVGLYAQYQRLKQAPDFVQWPQVRQRIIELALRDFRLSGVQLEGEARERFTALSAREAEVAQKFSENVLDAIDAYTLDLVHASRLAGVPPDVQDAARQTAQAAGVDGWRLTLKMPCYLPFMQYAQDRDLRATLYRAYGTVASEHGDSALDNSQLIVENLALRAEQAQLLGFATFANLRLATRMARTTEEVITFLRDLAARARPYAQRDLAELRAFARDTLGLDQVEPWDMPFVSEKLRGARYAYSEDEVKRYFTEPRVLSGLTEVIGTLFDVRLHDQTVSGWHDDVRALRVDSPGGQTLGYLYLDLYARAGKQGGAWVDSERSRRVTPSTVQTPVVYLTCNFSRPQGGDAALFTHDDVITLFHEAGHALHALLSNVDELGASAFASVEWDAIELPSQFMENFCWEWSVVQKLSAHVDTGEPLPRALFDRMVAARNFQTGMQTLRQIEFSLFDMLIHSHGRGLDIAQVMAQLETVRDEVSVTRPPKWHRFPHAFSHLFSGGYGAGYYSYKWAEVLSADAYGAFEEAAQASGGDTLHRATGLRFKHEVLAVGGIRPAAESFVAFRGRAPNLEALLRHQGMTEALEQTA
jgi:oligopeptidase A